MEFWFPHPENGDIWFRYDDTFPGHIRRRAEGGWESFVLTYKNVNCSDLLYCLLKGKKVVIEDREQAHAVIEGKRIVLEKPYDAKWALQKVLGFDQHRTHIISDRRAKTYCWALSDGEMEKPPETDMATVAQTVHLIHKVSAPPRTSAGDNLEANSGGISVPDQNPESEFETFRRQYRHKFLEHQRQAQIQKDSFLGRLPADDSEGDTP